MRSPLLPCSQLSLHQSAVAFASSSVANQGDRTLAVFFFLAVYMSVSRLLPRPRSCFTLAIEVLSHFMASGMWIAMIQHAGEGKARSKVYLWARCWLLVCAKGFMVLAVAYMLKPSDCQIATHSSFVTTVDDDLGTHHVGAKELMPVWRRVGLEVFPAHKQLSPPAQSGWVFELWPTPAVGRLRSSMAHGT